MSGAVDPVRLAVTPGEPAGIGPDLILQLAANGETAGWQVFADPELLAERARELGVAIRLRVASTAADASVSGDDARANALVVRPVSCPVGVRAGRLDPAAAGYVIASLEQAVAACVAGEAEALVTGPVHKATLNQAGVAFSGHTEWLAEQLGGHPVMLLVAEDALRVALVTTHLPLRAVPEAITGARIQSVIRTLDAALRSRFGVKRPHLLVCGLNPHSGEGGHLGSEEQTLIEPALAELSAEGLSLEGPLPADTVFTPQHLRRADAVVAMYHDQGLPVLKHVGFHRAVNITLGLPVIRTSVDHGTAVDLAGTGQADPGSLRAAARLACAMVSRHPA
jgi:4-hydroxythreonine-4-phosphate dehydrogenase